MSFLRKLKSYLFRTTPKFPVQTEHRIVYAFTVGGTDYFQFEDPFSAPPYRALGALMHYEELRMRTTREYLKTHVAAVRDILRSKTIDIYKLNQWNEWLSERLDWAIEPRLVLNLAAVVYFDASESPYSYDWAYCQKKIEKWMKDQAAVDFFLREPIVRLLPYLELSEQNLDRYGEILQKATQYQVEDLLKHISDKSLRESLSQTLQLAGLIHSNGVHLKNLPFGNTLLGDKA